MEVGYLVHHRRRRRLSIIRSLGLFRFRNFLKLMNLLRQLASLDEGLARRKASTYTQDNTTQKNADIHPCLEWGSNSRSQCSSGRRQYVPETPRSVGPADT
jgi:hypothetical protein